MKDHEIAQLVNKITEAVKPITNNQALRARISRAVVFHFKI